MDPTIAAEGDEFLVGTTAHAPPFDAKALEPASWREGLLFELLFRYPQRLINLLRWCPGAVCVWFPGGGIWHFILRQDEVREVLNHHEHFAVAWGGKMKELTNGKNFVLGMQYDAVYKKSYRCLARAFPIEDIRKHVEAPSAALAEAIVKEVVGRQPPRLDAIEELVTRIPAELCESYFGIQIPDKIAFAKWTLAISSYTFGPSPSAKIAALKDAAAGNLSAAIRASIAAAKKGDVRGKAMERLIELEKSEGLDDDDLHAYLFGMVMGFIPTNVLAGGNMLEMLLRRRDFLEHAQLAARADDDELLWRCLREAMRFRHINPGAWRECVKDYTLGAGTVTAHRIPAGRRIMALIQSAMFDGRRVERPHVFDPDRREEDYMTFGVGQHWCIGAYIAKAQITQTFKPLLKRTALRAVDNRFVRVTRFNALFPLHLAVEIDP